MIGFLFTKDLILCNPNDSVPVKTVLDTYDRKRPVEFHSDTSLKDVLQAFKTNQVHMAIVYTTEDDGSGKDPVSVTIGLVTLEDVLEEILQVCTLSLSPSLSLSTSLSTSLSLHLSLSLPLSLSLSLPLSLSLSL